MTVVNDSPLKVVIVDDDPRRGNQLEAALLALCYPVLGRMESAFELSRDMARIAPDVVIIGADSPDRDTLEQLCIATRDFPRPVVLFTGDKSPESIRAALKAGVSAYIVDGIDPTRIQPILEVARIRFEEHRRMLEQTLETGQRQGERSTIERAKQRLMKAHGLGEHEAYHTMRRTSMAENRRLLEVAEDILHVFPEPE